MNGLHFWLLYFARTFPSIFQVALIKRQSRLEVNKAQCCPVVRQLVQCLHSLVQCLHSLLPMSIIVTPDLEQTDTQLVDPVCVHCCNLGGCLAGVRSQELLDVVTYVFLMIVAWFVMFGAMCMFEALVVLRRCVLLILSHEEPMLWTLLEHAVTFDSGGCPFLGDIY